MTNDINNNLEPLADDELDEVSGGMSKSDIAAMAAADGRTVPLAAGNWFLGGGCCICAAKNKWAAKGSESKSGTLSLGFYRLYFDVKCYKCGKTWESVEMGC